MSEQIDMGEPEPGVERLQRPRRPTGRSSTRSPARVPIA